MNSPFVLFWTVMVFASIAWYAFLVYYVGIKAGRDIRRMTKSLEQAAKTDAARRGGAGDGAA